MFFQVCPDEAKELGLNTPALTSYCYGLSLGENLGDEALQQRAVSREEFR